MGPELVVILSILLLLVLLAAGVPVAAALATSGALGIILLRDMGVAGATLSGLPFSSTAVFALTVVPLFIFMGVLALHAGIADQLFDAAARVLRAIPAGLGIATIIACTGFAAVTGSSSATAGAVGRLSIGEMRKRGYSVEFASGIVAAGGTIGILIPPSIVLVIYGILTDVSIGALLLAGILPGLLSAAIYVIVAVYVGRSEIQSPSDTTEVVSSQRFGLTVRHYSGIAKMSVLAIVVLGGIYSGYFTATESAAVGALVAFVMLLTSRTATDSPWNRVRNSLSEATSITSMVFFVLLGGSIFAFMLISGGIPATVTRWATELSWSPVMIVLVLLLMLVPLGMFLDTISILLITMPLAFPVVSALGFDGVWFGVMVVKFVELGLITPPIGMNVYVISGVVPDVKVEQIFRGVLPFAVADIATIAVLFAFPSIITWLPGRVGI